MTTTTYPLDPAELATGGESVMAHGDIRVALSLSAYDVPRTVTVSRDQQGSWRIGFEYIDNEGGDGRRIGNDVDLYVGRKSGKILAIETKFHAPPASNQVPTLIADALRSEVPKVQRDNQRLNYRLVERIVETLLRRIIEEAPKR